MNIIQQFDRWIARKLLASTIKYQYNIYRHKIPNENNLTNFIIQQNKVRLDKYKISSQEVRNIILKLKQ